MNSKNSPVMRKLTSRLFRRKIPMANKIARWLLLDTINKHNNLPVLRLTKTNQFLYRIVCPDYTITQLKDQLVTVGLIEPTSVGLGGLSWVYRITPELQKLRQEFEFESGKLSDTSPAEKRLKANLDALKTKYKQLADIADLTEEHY